MWICRSEASSQGPHIHIFLYCCLVFVTARSGGREIARGPQGVLLSDNRPYTSPSTLGEFSMGIDMGGPGQNSVPPTAHEKSLETGPQQASQQV
jgi:hypothetical protein